MESYVCKKCSSDRFYLEEKGNNIGLYCSCCGNWVKWVSKKELSTLEKYYDYRKPRSEDTIQTAPKLRQSSCNTMCKELLECYGVANQKLMLAEVCSRTSEVILQSNRLHKQDTSDFVDCLAELSILLEQMKLSLSNEDLSKLSTIVTNKLNSQLDRVKFREGDSY